jgi:hypothetical protein
VPLSPRSVGAGLFVVGLLVLVLGLAVAGVEEGEL